MKISKKLILLPISVLALTGCGKNDSKEEDKPAAKTYTITWKNHDGSVLEVDKKVKEGSTPKYNGSKPAKASTNTEVFNFTGWSPKVVKVTKDATYTAQFASETRLYNVNWVDGDGNVIKTDHLEYEETPYYTGAEPTKEKTEDLVYTFTGWEEEIVPVTGDVTYHAAFSSGPRPYFTVSVINPDSATIYTNTKCDPGSIFDLSPVNFEYDDGSSKEYLSIGVSDELEPLDCSRNYIAVYLGFELEDDHYILDNITCSDVDEKDIVIPAEFNGKPVTKIGYMALSGVTCRSITLPNTITSIEERAFDSVHVRAIEIPGSVREIKQQAFVDAEDLELLYFNEGLETIRYRAFDGTGIMYLNLPETCTTVEELAFGNCHKLIKATINATSITNYYSSYSGNNIFTGSGSLTEITCANTEDYYSLGYYPQIIKSMNSETKDQAGEFNFIEPNNETNEIGKITYTNSATGSTVYLVGGYDYGDLTKKVLHTDGFDKIKTNAFEGTDIEEVYLSKDITNVGRRAFKDCDSLTTLELEAGDSNLVFGDDVFWKCDNIESVDLSPRKMSSLPSYTFMECTSLTSCVMSSSTTYIGGYALGHTALEEINIPEKVSSIDNDAFSRIDTLKKFIVDAGNTHYKVVDDCLYSYDGLTIYAFPSAKVVAGNEFTIPSTVKNITGRVFQNSTLEIVNLPADLEQLNGWTFMQASNLTTVNYPGTKAEFEALADSHWAVSVGFSEVNCLGDSTTTSYGIN